MIQRLLWLTLALALTFGRAGATEHALIFDLPQSRVEISVKATLDAFLSRLRVFEPMVTVDDEGQVVAAEFHFRFADIATGKPKRDHALHEWQQSDVFPDSHFVLSKLVTTAEGYLQAKGKLTLHGVTREISFPVWIAHDAGVIAIDGDALLDVRSFGLPVPRLYWILKVDPLVRVRFHLQGTIAS